MDWTLTPVWGIHSILFTSSLVVGILGVLDNDIHVVLGGNKWGPAVIMAGGSKVPTMTIFDKLYSYHLTGPVESTTKTQAVQMSVVSKKRTRQLLLFVGV